MSMNKFMVTGRLTADSELRFTQDGNTPVVNFTLANNWYVKNAEGVTEQKTQYIPISVFGPNAEKWLHTKNRRLDRSRGAYYYQGDSKRRRYKAALYKSGSTVHLFWSKCISQLCSTDYRNAST